MASAEALAGALSAMKFSIITPNLDYGRYLETCIESVLMQQSEGVEVEHIVMDAGSTDQSLEILARYPHLIWASEPDRGMSDGINKGFRRATGDWLMWLNADDGLRPGALARVRAFAEAHGTADVIHGDCMFVDEEFREVRRKFEHGFDRFVLLLSGCYIPSTSCFYRRRIIEGGEYLDLDYKVNMDFEYYVRLAHKGYRFAYLPAPLANFRWHDGNTSTLLADRRFEERRMVQRRYLKAMGLGFLSSNLALRTLFWAARVKRLANKVVRRLVGGYEA